MRDGKNKRQSMKTGRGLLIKSLMSLLDVRITRSFPKWNARTTRCSTELVALNSRVILRGDKPRGSGVPTS